VLEAACAAFFVCVLAVGCRSGGETAEPPPVVAPELEYGTRHFVGSVLSGPLPLMAVDDAADPADAITVHCELTYYEQLPQYDLPPLGTQARLIGSMRGENAILPSPAFTTRVQYATPDVAPGILEELESSSNGRSLLLHHFEGALLHGTSAVFAARSVELLELAIDEQAQRRMAFSFLRNAGDLIDFGIVVDQLAKPDDETIADSADEPLDLDPYLVERDDRVLQREYLLLKSPPVLDGGPILILAPSPFPGDEGAGFAMRIEVRSAPTAEPDASAHAELVAAMQADFVSEYEQAQEAARRLENAELQERQVAEALRNLRFNELQRKTLVFLTTTTGAPLAEDLALIVTDENLKLYADMVVAAAERSDRVMTEEGGLGWIFERGAFQFLTSSLSEDQISPSHFGLLLKHAGEAGQFPAIIEDALAVSQNRREFTQRIVEENRIFLEDHQVAARVRAYDWLVARDAAPEGYDPLGDADARREALSNDRRKRAAAKAEQAAKKTKS
jgi:hypothetical protein